MSEAAFGAAPEERRQHRYRGRGGPLRRLRRRLRTLKWSRSLLTLLIVIGATAVGVQITLKFYERGPSESAGQ